LDTPTDNATTAVQDSPRTESVLSSAGAWLCLGGAAVGALGLLGWIAGPARLTTIVSDLPPMMPNTALALLLIGGAGTMRQAGNIGTARSTLSLLATLAALAIGVGTLIEYGLGIDMRIDHFLSLTPSTSLARPSAPTALSLTFLATALLILDVGSTARIRPSELLVLCGALPAFAGLIGIVLDAPLLYRSTRTPIIGLSLLTALGLLLTSLGVLLLRPQAGIMRVATSPGPGGILLRRLGLSAIALPVGLGLVVTQLVATQKIEGISVPVAILAAAMAALSLLLLGATAPRLNRAYEDLQASRAHTRSLVEQAPDGIFVADLDGRYTDVNEAGCRMLGYTREEIVGKTIVDLIPSDDIERLLQSKEVLVQGPIHVAEWSLRRKDGSYVPVEVSAKILADGRWQGFVRDISERKRLEDEQRLLAALGAALATTLEYEETASRLAEVAAKGFSDFCIVDLVDDDGEMRRLRAVSRDPSRTLICDALEQLPPGAKRPPAIQSALESRQPVVVRRPTFQAVAAPAESADQLEAQRVVDLHSLLVLPLIAHGTLLGAISFLFATPWPAEGETLRMGQEIAQRAALALDDARLYRAAQRAIKARDDVLGIVAHDLRNPLSTILMQVHLLRRQGPQLERRSQDSGEAIQRAATRMDRLIQDLLDASRIEAGGLAVERRWVNVAEVASEAVRVQQPLASSVSLEIRLDVERDLPDVWADRDRLLQVFENLIGNAIKFTPPGGSITVRAARHGTDVLFEVRDTGPGIDIGDQPHVFDRFWQGRTKKRAGAGLGLPIVKGIVEAHAGRVWVEGALGQGSTFRFTVPTTQRIEWAPAEVVSESQ
jgi:PAS domain S-box-containing protein